MWDLREESDRTHRFISGSLLVAAIILLAVGFFQAYYKTERKKPLDPNGNPLATMKVENEAIYNYTFRHYDGLAPKYIYQLGQRVVDPA